MSNSRDISIELIKKQIPSNTSKKSIAISYTIGDDKSKKIAENLATDLNKLCCEAKLIDFASLGVQAGTKPAEIFSVTVMRTDMTLAIGTLSYAKQIAENAESLFDEKGFSTRFIKEVMNREKALPLLFEGTLETSFPMLKTYMPFDFIKNNYFQELLSLIINIHNLNNKSLSKSQLVEEKERKEKSKEHQASGLFSNQKLSNELPSTEAFNVFFGKNIVEEVEFEDPGLSVMERTGERLDRCFRLVLEKHENPNKIIEFLRKNLFDNNKKIEFSYAECCNPYVAIPLKHLPLIHEKLQAVQASKKHIVS